MTETVAPGRQCVTVLKKQMFLVIESPTINVVAEKRGQGDDGGWRLEDVVVRP